MYIWIAYLEVTVSLIPCYRTVLTRNRRQRTEGKILVEFESVGKLDFFIMTIHLVPTVLDHYKMYIKKNLLVVILGVK